jgi:class 3 adenylate cyclase/pimeloyl-ACP methyl ester carboxylesterase
MEPRIQYAKTSDGVSIAYWAIGSGEPYVITYSPGTGHAQLEWEIPEAKAAYLRLAERRTIVRLDWRNNGLSTRGVGDLSLEAHLLDLEAVLGRLDVSRYSLHGGTISSKVVIRYAAEHPDQVSRLTFYAPTAASGSMHRTYLGGDRALMLLDGIDWDIACEIRAVILAGLDNPEFTRRLSRLFKEAGDAGDFQSHWRGLIQADVSELLPHVRAPSLLLYEKTGSRGHDIDISRSIAAALPDARMAALESGKAYPYPWDEPTVSAIEEFLDERVDGSSQERIPSGTAVILFADIVDSTATTERLGDAAYRTKARELGASLRALVRECAGTPVEGPTLGDGVLAVFTSAREAIEAARRCGKAGDDAGLPLHLGLHAGDITREKDPDGRDNVYGGAVNIASRISGLSAPGEVLVSETVRSLARTSAGVRFEDRGEQALKGVGEPVRVWAIVWPGANGPDDA